MTSSDVAADGAVSDGAPSDDAAGTPAVSESAVRRLPGIALAAIASIGAGAIHAAAVGIHAEHPALARLFVATAALQLGAGLWALHRPSRAAAAAVVAVNVGAVAGWLASRITGISWIGGLEQAEAPQFADSACAGLGAAAVAAAGGALLIGWHEARPARMLLPSFAATALVVPAMMLAGTHIHAHDEGAADGHAHGEQVANGAAPAHDHGGATDAAAPHDHGAVPAADPAAHDPAAHDHGTIPAADPALAAANWPRPWDPSQPIDLAGVPGVSPEQEARARALVETSMKELPRFANPADAVAAGYQSIGDAGTGSEHYINAGLVQDDALLDPTAPESLVYTVDGEKRTLAGAMYIASARPTDDPTLTSWAGPLMTWHNHGNLCWEGQQVVGVSQADGSCARGNNSGAEFPMVHVWITPHPCGVFAALEGVGAGQAAVPEAERVDMCAEQHDHGGATAAAATPKPYDPTKPIDLSGTPGVTPEQQAAAENIVAENVMRLPQWADYNDAIDAGFASIGDGSTGHEHYINWDWIDDDVVLDPDYPEALVYSPQPDGSKKLVSAMYMLQPSVALADVPDIGGALMQWHIHDDLCFTKGYTPRVAGVTGSNGKCPSNLQKFTPAPMIHVWITPHKCGPFAALEGVGAGQIQPGEERLCDHQHGGGF
jgi:hypothetical protein